SLPVGALPAGVRARPLIGASNRAERPPNEDARRRQAAPAARAGVVAVGVAGRAMGLEEVGASPRIVGLERQQIPATVARPVTSPAALAGNPEDQSALAADESLEDAEARSDVTD